MKKKIIRLTESDLHKIIKESVNKILMESKFDEFIANDLKLPYEQRYSHMTDDEINGMLAQHKKRDMEYDAEQLKQQQEQEMLDKMPPYSIENPNIKDNKGKFSNSSSYVRGDFKNIKI